jgi:hypothetical protein
MLVRFSVKDCTKHNLDEKYKNSPEAISPSSIKHVVSISSNTETKYILKSTLLLIFRSTAALISWQYVSWKPKYHHRKLTNSQKDHEYSVNFQTQANIGHSGHRGSISSGYGSVGGKRTNFVGGDLSDLEGYKLNLHIGMTAGVLGESA